MSKKICILSMQRVQNTGSLLQSYALMKTLKSLGCAVSFIDIEKNAEDNRVVPEKKISFSGEMECNAGFGEKLKKIDRYTINRIRIKIISRKQEKIFESFRKEVLHINRRNNEDAYDLCIIGSDEVFNCMTPSDWGFTSQLFGNIRQAKEVITYAASCGATKYENLNKEMIRIISHSFLRISGFSARDKNTGEFIRHLTNNTVEFHLDPVLVTDFKRELSQVKTSLKLPEKYCVVYSYYNRIHEKRDIEEIKRFCKRKKMKIVALGAPQMWIWRYHAYTPFEAMKVIENAEFVITDTFHGLIFSEKLNGKFAVYVRESNKNKMEDLIERLNIENHVIHNFKELERVYQITGDRQVISEKISEEKKRSEAYLRKYCM